jgi:NADH-quinone oxidoreductase subunit A
MTPTALVAYLTVFIVVGIIFLFVSLLIGRFVRPRTPSAGKLETYECGEPPVGSGFAQFDLRFYVVALLFLVFEVELAFFFPPAVIFGKLTQRMRPSFSPPASAAAETSGKPSGELDILKTDVLPPGNGGNGIEDDAISQESRTLAAAAMIDMGLFFAVLLVGFAYLWKRGDLNWVRALPRPHQQIEMEAEAWREWGGRQP